MMSPLLKQGALDFISHSEAQTLRLGARLGPLLQAGDVIALIGELGTGKTRWVQGICQGLGVDVPVVSPTFTLVNEYEGPLPIYHIDLYRLADQAEIGTIGIDDYLYGPGVSLVEWANRTGDALADDFLTVELFHLEDTKRRISISAKGERSRTLLQTYNKVAFAQPAHKTS